MIIAEYSSKSVLVLLFLCAWLLPFFIPHVALPYANLGAIDDEYEGGDMLFVGDIMLGRHVETLMNEYGLWYPFVGTERLIEGVDVAVGNFEATVPKEHSQTPNRNLKLSVKEAYMGTLRDVGFDILSLANNHSYDFGKEGYENTLRSCKDADLVCGGHPYEVLPLSAVTTQVGDARVGVIFLHGISVNTDDKSLSALMAELKRTTDIQLVFIHWGEEYNEQHNEAQEKTAHILIDNGIDAIIGHHSHVVQDIEMYGGKPIFYSLGNFVFDQYFDEYVQNGFGIKMSIEKDFITYTVIPFTSETSKSQPHIMGVDEKGEFIKKYNDLSTIKLDMQNPSIVVPR